jgi:hypothetical protein
MNYDLSRDREERFNRIGDYLKNMSQNLSLLSAWVRHQNRLFKRLIPDD